MNKYNLFGLPLGLLLLMTVFGAALLAIAFRKEKRS